MFPIPQRLWKYQTQNGYFVTYFGDIYFGRIVTLNDYEDRFFILGINQAQRFDALKPNERTLENYSKLTTEIRDADVIRDVWDEFQGRDAIIHSRARTNEQQFKRMFVFGAAASAFCTFNDTENKLRNSKLSPPTGFEVFDEKYQEIINKYPAIIDTIPVFESMNKDIEGCMQEEWRTFKNHYSPKMAISHINIQFYLQELLQTVSKHVVENHSRNNLYSLLLNKLRRKIAERPKERISLVSFNYDTILDQYISRLFSQPFDTMDDYINWERNNILLFKPHGSCNWGWKFRKDRINGNTQSTISDALYTGNIEPWWIYYHLIGERDEVVAKNTWGIAQDNNEHHIGHLTINKNLIEIIQDGSQDVYFPSLLLPYRDKDEMVMPYSHYFALKECMGEIEELYLIGWKGNEELFNKLLQRKSSNKLRKIIIVNPREESNKEVSENLNKVFGDINSKYQVEVVKDFEQFVVQDLDRFLVD